MAESGGRPAFRLDVRIRLYDGGELVYGKGVSALLRLCDEHGSLSTAARKMGMSYRKALALVHRAEAGLGRPILEKTIGGAGGGGSRLTDFGCRLVEQFTAVEAEVEAYAAGRLAERLPGLAEEVRT